MAITATLNTRLGEERLLYVRLNSGTESKSGAPVPALFRGYLSQAIFEAKEANPDQGGDIVAWEKEITFTLDVTKPFRGQAYAALQAIPVQAIPAEPEAPAALASDATDDEKMAYETAQNEYTTQHAAWETQSTQIEAENAEALALAHGTEA